MKGSAVECYENFYGHFSVQICARYSLRAKQLLKVFGKIEHVRKPLENHQKCCY